MSRSKHVTLAGLTRDLSKAEVAELFADSSDDRVTELLENSTAKTTTHDRRKWAKMTPASDGRQ